MSNDTDDEMVSVKSSELVALAEKIGTLEQKMNAVPQDRHTEEHEYMRLEIERRKAQRDFWLDIRKKLATTSILGAFSLLGMALLYALAQWIKNLGP